MGTKGSFCICHCAQSLARAPSLLRFFANSLTVSHTAYCDKFGAEFGEELAHRTYTSNLIGRLAVTFAGYVPDRSGSDDHELAAFVSQ